MFTENRLFVSRLADLQHCGACFADGTVRRRTTTSWWWTCWGLLSRTCLTSAPEGSPWRRSLCSPIRLVVQGTSFSCQIQRVTWFCKDWFAWITMGIIFTIQTCRWLVASSTFTTRTSFIVISSQTTFWWELAGIVTRWDTYQCQFVRFRQLLTPAFW